ncbi:MAG: ECF transporter S component [Sphaerochaetaceae bacterium]|jgi:uncharacterized membrane protein
MSQKQGSSNKVALRLALVAILTAVTVVFTMIVRIPTTKGYINLGDVAICFTAFTFGPWSAFIAGGLGTALADLISGYAQWAPISFIVHGVEALVIALLVRSRAGRDSAEAVVPLWRKILAGIAGMAIVAGGYFVGGGALISGFSVAAVEIPANLAQSGIGVVLGLAVSQAVRRAYPPVRSLSW